jgi:hypothetical protein
MKNTFIFFFLFIAASLSAQQKVSSLKNSADGGSILVTDSAENAEVIPVVLSSEKMPLPSEAVSPLKVQAVQPATKAVPAVAPVKVSDKIEAPKAKK